MADLPTFRYHPDPLATGAIRPSDEECICCSQARGFIYTGPVYAEEDLDDSLCPWCIADGTAAATFAATFVDEDGIGGYGAWDPVPAAVTQEVAQRTPAFSGWQQERWWTHCRDAAEFLGVAGRRELEERWPGAIPLIRTEAGYEASDWAEYFAALDRQHGPTAYVFRCHHCGQLGGYSDSH
jgi:uncharacterized protein CbrC (UPF0167 family)